MSNGSSRRGDQIIGDADLLEVTGPDNLKVIWRKRLTVEEAQRSEPYPHYVVNADDPWADFERQAGLAEVEGLEYDEITV